MVAIPKPAKPATLPMPRERIERQRHMHINTRKSAQKVGELLVAADTHATLAHYDIGQELLNVQANPGLCHGESGESAVAQIAGYWALGTKTAANYIAIARTFDRAFVEEWSKKAMPGGRTLTTSHWILLAQLATAGDRDRMLKLAYKRSMTVPELADQMKKLTKTHGTRGSRGPSRRASTVQEIRAIGTLAARLAKYRANVRDYLLPALIREGLTDVTRERATELLAVLSELREFVDETEVGLTHVLQVDAPEDVAPTEEVRESHETGASVEEQFGDDEVGAVDDVEPGDDVVPDETTELPEDFDR